MNRKIRHDIIRPDAFYGGCGYKHKLETYGVCNGRSASIGGRRPV